VAVTPDGKFVYVADALTGDVSAIATATNTVTATIVVESGFPNHIALTPDGKFVYVSHLEDKTVSVIDTTTNTVTATVRV
jgi:YVTN family beta-propeller protein